MIVVAKLDTFKREFDEKKKAALAKLNFFREEFKKMKKGRKEELEEVCVILRKTDEMLKQKKER